MGQIDLPFINFPMIDFVTAISGCVRWIFSRVGDDDLVGYRSQGLQTDGMETTGLHGRLPRGEHHVLNNSDVHHYDGSCCPAK